MKKLNVNGIIMLILFFIILCLGYMYFNQRNKYNETILDRDKLEIALNDSINRYINKNGELVSEKKTLQTSVETLENTNLILTDNQKKLLDKVKSTEKEKELITAALIQTRIELDSLKKYYGDVDTVNKTINFIENTKDLQFNALIGNVIPFGSKKPYLQFKNFSLPNEQYVEFHWEKNKNEGYPISFSVANSNQYYKTYNIDSYAIPELKKPLIKPTGWEKVKFWFGNNWDNILCGAIGASAGYLLVK